MSEQPLACVILAAGQGTRMKSALPKSAHKLAGFSLLSHILNTLEGLSPDRIIVVTNPEADSLCAEASAHERVVQQQPLGTGDAVKAALPALEGFAGDVLIVLGDTPLIGTETLKDLVAAKQGAGISVLGVEYDHPPPYGRIVMNGDAVEKIIEHKDCTEEERRIGLCNTGIFCVDGVALSGWLLQITNDNAQGEYYITDLLAIAAGDGVKTTVSILKDAGESTGVNTRNDLANMEKAMQDKLRAKAMENGATLVDPATVYFAADTKIGKDVTIEPGVFFGPGVTVGDGVHIRAFSYIEDSVLEDGAVIGPFARVRGGSTVCEGAHIGTFVEINKTRFGKNSKAMHQTYLSMTDLGENCNIGAGVITCNYDGFKKHNTVIEENVFVGSNTNLIAPVKLEKGSLIAAGSTITKDVPADALAVAREKAVIKDGWAAKNRKKKAG